MQRNKISFKGQKIFVGIDVHKDSWRVAIAPEVGVIKGHSQKPSAQELFDFLKKHYPDGDYLSVYESGFSGFSTYYALEAVGIGCIVIHAADVPTSQYDEVMKTDKADATKLVKSLKSGLLIRICLCPLIEVCLIGLLFIANFVSFTSDKMEIKIRQTIDL